MESGQWMMTGEPLIFDENGNLADGQHRLIALIQSKMSFQFMVVRGVRTDSFIAMNRGKSRSNGNIFAIHGVPNYNATASVCAGVLNYRRAMAIPIKKNGEVIGYGGSLNSYVRASSADLIKEYDENAHEYNLAVSIAGQCRKLAPQSAVSTVAALALIDSRHSIEEVMVFWDGFRTGANLESDDPILYLKTKMSENSNAKNKMTANMIIALMIETWNRYGQGRSCKFIRIARDAGCPKIL